MASLEYISYTAWRESTSDGILWQRDSHSIDIEKLPQIFWRSGESWAEVNHWALERAATGQVKLRTVVTLLKHLLAYANYLENAAENIRGNRIFDWRHFPIRKEDRVLVRFRGHLMEQIRSGQIKPSTARSRINAVTLFYRHARHCNFVSRDSPLWIENQVIHSFFDEAGFKRTIMSTVTDLSIKNTKVQGLTLEDGLLPLSEKHMAELMEFSQQEASREIQLMLETGFFTGARIGSITTIRIENLESARPDPYMQGFHLMRAGPGTCIATKFDVEGELLVPDFMLESLKEYAYSTERLIREAGAKAEDKSLLFLTSRRRPFSVDTVGRLIRKLRKVGTRNGMKFLDSFKFHQTRATYGTWVMQISLGVTDAASAVAFVMQVMFHKDEATTFGYVKFLERSAAKQAVGEAFYRAFTGLRNRKWGDFSA